MTQVIEYSSTKSPLLPPPPLKRSRSLISTSSQTSTLVSGAFNLKNLPGDIHVDHQTGLLNIKMNLFSFLGNGAHGPKMVLNLVYHQDRLGTVDRFNNPAANIDNIGMGWQYSLTKYEPAERTLLLGNGSTVRMNDDNKPQYLKLKTLDINVRPNPSTGALKEIILTYKNGRKEYLNEHGRLTGIVSPQGYALNLQYDDATNLTAITGAEDTFYGIHFTQDRKTGYPVISSLDSSGEIVSYTLLLNSGRLDGIIDPLGRTTEFTYAPQSSLITKMQLITGAFHQIEYLPEGLKVPRGGPYPYKPAVAKFGTYSVDGQSDPVIETFDYGRNEGNNYLGYGTNNSFKPYEDNLYYASDNYRYVVSVIRFLGDISQKTIRTYNKYHLLLQEEILVGTHLARNHVYTYLEWENKTVDELPPAYTLPIRIEQSSYQFDGGKDRGPYTRVSQYKFDDYGNILEYRNASGLVKQFRYYPTSSASGNFVNALKSVTILPDKEAPTTASLKFRYEQQFTTLKTHKNHAFQVVTSGRYGYSENAGDMICRRQTGFTYDRDPASQSFGFLSSEEMKAVGDVDALVIKCEHDYQFENADSLAFDCISTGHTFINNSDTAPNPVICHTDNPLGLRTTSCDAMGNHLTYSYDRMNRITREQYTSQDGRLSYQKKYEYSFHAPQAGSETVTEISSDDYKIRHIFDSLGRVVELQQQMCDSERLLPDRYFTLEQTTYNNFNEVESNTLFDADQTGKIFAAAISKYSYDGLGRVVESFNPDGTREVTVYDDVALRTTKYVISSGESDEENESNANTAAQLSSLVTCSYNDNYQVIATYVFSPDPDFKNNSGSLIYTASLTNMLSGFNSRIAAGHLIPSAELNTFIRRAVARKNYVTFTQNSYDGFGRLIQRQHANGDITRMRYDNEFYQNESGKFVFGRLIDVVYPNGVTASSEYNLMNKRTKSAITDDGVTIVLAERTYNALGRLVEFYDSGHQKTQYAHDLNGNVVTVTMPGGDVIVNAYTADNFPKSSYTLHDNKQSNEVSWVYAPDTRLLLEMIDKKGITENKYRYDYFPNSRPSAITYPDNKRVDFNYSQQSRILNSTDIAGVVTAQNYDGIGRLKQLNIMGTGGRSWQENYRYNHFGRFAGSNLNGKQTTVSYNSLDQVSQMRYRLNDADFCEIGYAYYDDGSLHSKHISYPQDDKAREEIFSYDRLGQLARATYQGELAPRDELGNSIQSVRYAYSAIGNLTSEKTAFIDPMTKKPGDNTVTYSYDSTNPLQLKAYTNSDPAYANSQIMEYDANGNLTKDANGNILSYNALGNLVQFESAPGSKVTQNVRYQYNGWGDMVLETVSDPATPSSDQANTFYYVGSLINRIATRSTKKNTSSYFHKGIGIADDILNGGTLNSYITDISGNVLHVATSGENKWQVQNQYAYAPYGVSSKLTTSQKSPVASNWHLKFDGKITNTPTGCQFSGNGSRVYHPGLERFIQRDVNQLSPFGKGGINADAFANGYPVMFTGPSGESFVSILEDIGIALAAASISPAPADAGDGIPAAGVAAGEAGGDASEAVDMAAAIIDGRIGVSVSLPGGRFIAAAAGITGAAGSVMASSKPKTGKALSRASGKNPLGLTTMSGRSSASGSSGSGAENPTFILPDLIALQILRSIRTIVKLEGRGRFQSGRRKDLVSLVKRTGRRGFYESAIETAHGFTPAGSFIVAVFLASGNHYRISLEGIETLINSKSSGFRKSVRNFMPESTMVVRKIYHEWYNWSSG